MDDSFRRLIDELQSLATEDEQSLATEDELPLVEGPALMGEISYVEPVSLPVLPEIAKPAMPLPRTVRGRRY